MSTGTSFYATLLLLMLWVNHISSNMSTVEQFNERTDKNDRAKQARALRSTTVERAWLTSKMVGFTLGLGALVHYTMKGLRKKDNQMDEFILRQHRQAKARVTKVIANVRSKPQFRNLD